MRALIGALCVLGVFAAAPHAMAEPASAHTRAQNVAFARDLPFEDREDEDFAARGFIGTRADTLIRAEDGRPVWNLAAYDWMADDPPASVNPSLWRHARLLVRHGLFTVSPRIHQVRGFDVSNMTIIEGDTGFILVDPLTNVETAAAALELARAHLGDKPVRAVIYTHSHADHFGGVRGVVDAADVAAGRVRIIAPAGFMEHAISENIIAGNAMGRRATYQFGAYLAPGPEGQVTSGIGPAIPSGRQSLIAPTLEITRTGETLTIDGVRIVFQLTPNTEAPAEMNFFLPDLRALCLAENANASMHNVLTPRGALVRDAKAWADYLTEALRLYGDQSDVMFTSHAWPRFGQARVADFIASHRDAYKYLHDQSVRLMNQGLTGPEIAERIALPDSLARRWFNRGYYGTMRHNARAVYQRYMGWYEGHPARLNPLPHEESAARYVEMMGGPRRVLRAAERASADGDYRWAAELLDKLVFADPTNEAAKAALARALTQLGFQSESAIWRNMYLMGAAELAGGVVPRNAAAQAGDLVAATPTSAFFDLMAVRLNPEAAAGKDIRVNFVFPDRNERIAMTIRNSVLVHEAGVTLADAQANVTLPRPALLALLGGGGMAAVAGQVRIEGDRAALLAMAGLFDTPDPSFQIVTP